MKPACWNCQEKTTDKDLFCNNCKHIQPVYTISIYELFGIKTSFEIKNEELTENYFTKQKQIHPDRFITKSPQEKEHAINQGARLNEAYKVLCNNTKRAEYLTKLLKLDAKEEEISQFRQSLIMEQFELREELENATNNESIAKLKNKINTQINACVESLSKAFKEKSKQTINQKIMELQFLEKIQQNIKNIV